MPTGPPAEAQRWRHVQNITEMLLAPGRDTVATRENQHGLWLLCRGRHPAARDRHHALGTYGRHEQNVPIIVSQTLSPASAARLRAGVENRDLHDLVLNGIC